MTTDPSARCAPTRSADESRQLSSSWRRDSAGLPIPAVVDTCLRVTRGTPFLLRELVEAVSEGGIAAARCRRRSVARFASGSTGCRSMPGSSRERWRFSSRADLLLAARLAGLDELEAADAADLLATAGILEPGRPLTFVHPIVRNGIYSELSSAERAQGHRRAAELLAEQPGASARVAQHLLVSEPAGDGWVVERLVEAARAAGKQGAPESQAVFLRRALAEPPPPGDQPALLLDLGMAEASAGLADWAEHLQAALDTAPNAAAAADAAMVLAHALSRAQRFAEAVEVLDRASRRRWTSPLGARARARGGRRRRRDERPCNRTLRRSPPPDVARPRRRRAPGAAGAAGGGRVHLRPDERARRGRRRACRPGAACRTDTLRRRGCSRGFRSRRGSR